MNGVCQACGKKTDKLRSCPICGAQVCGDCLTEKGCKLCQGRIQG